MSIGDLQQQTKSESAVIPGCGKSGIKPFRYVNLRLPEHRAQRQRLMPRTRPGKPTKTSQLDVTKESAGAPPTFFLRTKLLPPRPVPELLSRPRLADRLSANLENPLLLVKENSGSG